MHPKAPASTGRCRRRPTRRTDHDHDALLGRAAQPTKASTLEPVCRVVRTWTARTAPRHEARHQSRFAHSKVRGSPAPRGCSSRPVSPCCPGWSSSRPRCRPPPKQRTGGPPG
ncbi:hypothetical protein ACU686_19920 [Yinghuangia aomiensis]